VPNIATDRLALPALDDSTRFSAHEGRGHLPQEFAR
jgi:hypothetical protein